MALVHALAIVAFSYTLAMVVTGIIDGAPASSLVSALWWFVAAALARGLALLALDVLGHRSGAIAKEQLRAAVIGKVARRGAASLGVGSVNVTTLLGRGLDALDSYFGKYLPQLIMTAVTTPVVLVVLYVNDLITGIAVTITLPLIPVFMALVGWVTQSIQDAQWRALGALSRAFVDTIEGLATLKIFGRHWRQRDRIAELTQDYRTRTMKVLRVSFLSAFVLELAASLSVAIVAVSIGVRLIDEAIPLSLGLFVLILVPEIFLPLRAVGAQYHAATEGLSAASDIFDVLEAPHPAPGASATSAESRPTVVLEGFQALRADQPVHRPLALTLRPGEVVGVAGPSGAGKSSVLDALLGFAPYRGTIRVGALTLESPAHIRDLVAWAPQRPELLYGTVLDNVTLGDPLPDVALAKECLRLAGLDGLDLALDVGEASAGLSGGQAHRVALARAYYRAISRDVPFVLLDEVTGSLDEDTEARVIQGFHELARGGRGVVIVTHRERVLESATTSVALRPLRQAVPR